MWLILADQSDPEGPWLAQGLEARGLDAVELITTEQLLAARGIAHRVGRDGATFHVRLADGRVLDSRQVRGAVNRIGFLPPDQTIVADDAEYVAQERNAVWLSMLACLRGCVLNPPSPRGLAGAWRQQSEWVALAGSAGMAHEPFSSIDCPEYPPSFGAARGVETPLAVTFGSEVVDNGLPEAVRDQCRRLALAAQTPMLGITFKTDDDGTPVFVGANPRPDLRLAGDAVLDALHYVFEGARS